MSMAFIASVIGDSAVSGAAEAAKSLAGNYWILIAAVALIVVTVIIFLVLRQIVINSVLGFVVWGVIHFVFNIELPFFPALVSAAIGGPAGIATVLLLKFLGVG
ncbi:MAG: hypothetical protein J4415_03040 [Candidatus Diapherotrites archaeon]|uniref:Uncharacterized protein n=1 Tax=Candidatus Iainarchaeum sp. TaxID=3101447 RepID=A0A8T4KVK6_9ARCH|nr:hypothetical protein [Candidatus Diapherotrites archaeon]